MILQAGEILGHYHIRQQVRSDECAYRAVYEADYVEFGPDNSPIIEHGSVVCLVVYQVDLMPAFMHGEEHIVEFEQCKHLAGKMFFQIFDLGREVHDGYPLAWMAMSTRMSTIRETLLLDGDWLKRLDPTAEHRDIMVRLIDLSRPLRELDDLWFNIMDDVLCGLQLLSTSTNGGGHFNLTPDHIWVALHYDFVMQDGGLGYRWEYLQAYIVDFSHASGPCSGSVAFDAKTINPLYRARETYLGRFTEASDIYSLGLILYYMLRGDYPVRVPASVTGQDIPKFVARSVEAPEADEKYAAALEVALKAMSLKVSDRYRTIEELHRALYRAHNSVPHLDIMEIGEEAKRSIRQIEREARLSAAEALRRAEAEWSSEMDTQRDGAPHLDVELKVRPGDGFKAVAGMEDLKQKLHRDFVDIVSHQALAKQFDIVPPNLLLIGPPGTGKTYLSMRLAEECGMACSVINPSDLGSIYVHGSQSMIKELFDKAEQQARESHQGVLLIFDEFDAFCPKRTPEDRNNQSGEVAEFLVQLNNCIERNIYVVGTTNCPDRIDKAVIRKGRIDEVIYVGMPDEHCREQLFEYELKKRPHDEGIDLKKLVQLTAGYTSSDIAYLVKESARCAFEASIAANDTVTNISQSLLEGLIERTSPSVSTADLHRYERLRDEFTQRNKEDRRKVGFKY
jgi:transitional endoplasmic reticulum ATPase